MPDTLWSFLGWFGAGALGWFGANFIGKPLMDFLALRKEIEEELTFLSNVDPPHIGIKYEYGDDAYDKYRNLFDVLKRR
jgi:hypothetical protein